MAVAQNGALWAAGRTGVVNLYRGFELVAEQNLSGFSSVGLDFSRDGKELFAGIDRIDASTGAPLAAPPIDGLVEWGRQEGLPVPPVLHVKAARYRDDGEVLVVYATGIIRDRRRGRRHPKTGDADWLFVLDGRSRSPRAAAWHGKGSYRSIAVGNTHAAAAGRGGLRIFELAAAAPEKTVDLASQLRLVVQVAWSPDGSLLAAVGETCRIAIWKAGAWDAPVASWTIGTEHIRGISFHPSRPLLLTGGHDGFVRGWSLSGAELSAPREIFNTKLEGQVSQLAVAPGGDMVLVAINTPAGFVEHFDLTLAP